MNSEQRKAMQDHLDEVLGYSLEADGAHETIRDVMPDTIHTWILLSILDRLEALT